MALTGAQKVTCSEITRETLSTIDSLATELTADQETWIATELALWATSRNDLEVEMGGGSSGVELHTKELLDEIRARVRNAFGLDPFPVNEQSGSVAVRHAVAW